MISHNSTGKHNKTRFIQLNTRLCTACWSCIEVCENKVIGKINLPFHKHARINYPEECKGCKKCVQACTQGAISYIYVPSASAIEGKTSS